MNTKNRAERLRAPLCLKKEGQDKSKSFACDAVGTQHVTQSVSTMQTTCIDGLLSSGGDQNAEPDEGSWLATLRLAYLANSMALKGYAEVSA